jgi:hypothetical protein
VRRRGFLLVLDFSGAVHSFTGATLPAAIVDCLGWQKRPTREDMLKAYIAVSRVRHLDTLLLAQAYSPWLFRQGELPGPHLLMDFWLHGKTLKTIVSGWEKSGKTTLGWKEWKDMLYPCSACSEFNSCEVLLPLTAFRTDHWWERCVAMGADATCSGCAAKRTAAQSGMRVEPLGRLNKKETYYCTRCKSNQPEDAFDAAKLTAWRKHCHYARMECSRHSKESFGRERGSVRCSKCGEDRHRPEYDTATLARLEDNDMVADAVCLRCDASGLKGNKENLAKKYTCNHCGLAKAIAAYSGVVHKMNDVKKMRCLDCQMPACSQCKARPERALRHPVPTGTYTCQKCLCPPCARCKKTARPDKGTKWNVFTRKEWVCLVCRGESA